MTHADYPKLRTIIGKKIDIGYNDNVVNSYVIKELLQTDEVMPVRGKMYKGLVEYDNPNMDGAYPALMFDAQTLTELLFVGVAMNPFMSGMYYAMAETDETDNAKEKPKAQQQKKVITKDEIIAVNAKNINAWHEMANDNNLMAFMILFATPAGEITLGCVEGLSKEEIVGRLRYLANMLEKNPVVQKTS